MNDMVGIEICQM